eukprot:COSAG04_NODE_2071_length_4866_cov_24.794210_1_plen_206_part_00
MQRLRRYFNGPAHRAARVVTQSGATSQAVVSFPLACFAFLGWRPTSNGHLFLDESLGVAGASDKTRAMFRAVYGKANAVVRVRKGNGEEVFSESFDVRRGVVQGDIFSPLCFIIALARVMELHDTKLQGDGLQLGHGDQQEGAYAKLIIRALLHADDAAILCKDEKEATVRLCSIQSGSKESADMELSIPNGTSARTLSRTTLRR